MRYLHISLIAILLAGCSQPPTTHSTQGGMDARKSITYDTAPAASAVADLNDAQAMDTQDFSQRPVQAAEPVEGQEAITTSATPSRSTLPDGVGWTGYVSTYITKSYTAARRLDQLILAEDQVGVDQLEAERVALWFDGDVRIIQVMPGRPSSYRYCEVRILEGPLKDESVWCSLYIRR